MSEGETKEPFSEAWQKRNQINPRENPSEGRGNTSSARRATRVASRRCEDRPPCGVALDRGERAGVGGGFQSGAAGDQTPRGARERRARSWLQAGARWPAGSEGCRLACPLLAMTVVTEICWKSV